MSGTSLPLSSVRSADKTKRREKFGPKLYFLLLLIGFFLSVIPTVCVSMIPIKLLRSDWLSGIIHSDDTPVTEQRESMISLPSSTKVPEV